MKSDFLNNVSKSQVDKLAEADRMTLGQKLVSHAKGPMFDAVEYKRYVVNGVLYCTLNVDEEKKVKTVECVSPLKMVPPTTVS
jgi:hypothetical protein